jgi:hypothetical protein
MGLWLECPTYIWGWLPVSVHVGMGDAQALLAHFLNFFEPLRTQMMTKSKQSAWRVGLRVRVSWGEALPWV